MKKILLYANSVIFIAITLCSCQDSHKKHLTHLVNKWENKEILFPTNSVFIIKGKDTVDFTPFIRQSHYKILTYVDSTGCTSCKLKLYDWKWLIQEFDSLKKKVAFLFYYHTKDKAKLLYFLQYENFNYPACIDDKDSLNILNRFPTETMFQTFLLDQENKVIAIGNPIHNHKVKELYLKIIKGEAPSIDAKQAKPMTSVTIDQTAIDMGTFSWQKGQTASFTLINTGDKPLVIEAVGTSCGCVTVEYPKEPVRPGGHATLQVTYKADQPEHFLKTGTVYCNAEESPIKLEVSGNAI